MDRSSPIRPLETQVLDRQPLRVRADHEGFLDFHAGAIAHVQELPGLVRRQRNRLFAEHVLAVLGRLHAPRHVQMIRQRIVDGVDVRVDEEVVV